MRDIHEVTRGRWRGILTGLGVSVDFLTGKHGPCPICAGGRDRWRWDDKGGDGTWFCTHCGAGNGVDLVLRLKGVDFVEGKRLIEAEVGHSPIVAPRASVDTDRAKDQMAALWGAAKPLDGSDVASAYLSRRKIVLRPLATACRWVAELPHWNDDTGIRTVHPALLSKFVAPDAKSAILHRTYLAEPGVKASLPKPRMMMPGKIPRGGAVRLGTPAETMGIAEGIETALSASQLLEVPVWATLGTGQMLSWVPPPECKYVLIFGDRDKGFGGQQAAYCLAYRLKTEKYDVEVRLPGEDGEDVDWNDVLCQA